MSKLFICHAAADAANIANELTTQLEAQGRPCWIAPRDVTPGRTYPEQIMSAIRECRGMVLLVTHAANTSADVLQEVKIAHTQKKVIVPIVVGDVQPSDGLEYFLAVVHRLPWTSLDSVSAAVAQSLPLADAQIDSESMSALQAIAGAAAAEQGIVGSFKIVVRSTGSDANVAWLCSEMDYRDPRCLSVAVNKEARKQLANLYGKDPADFFKNRTIIVHGIAKKVRIDFVQGGKTGLYYYQTHVNVTDAGQVELTSAD
jgi:hypothetical protein